MPLWKRSTDVLGCVVALPVLAVCTLVMTVVAKIVSPGPVFFRQERVGFNGKRFKIYKFRTMTVGADTSAHHSYSKELIGTNAPMMKLDARGDSRLIPGAWVLRATGLDELPQLINVLRGEMSLVGPRPCIPQEFEHYSAWQRKRFEVMPGITGLWQVSGKNRTTFEEMIRLDTTYSQRLSLPMDVKIIAKTIPCLAYQVYETHKLKRSLRHMKGAALPLPSLPSPANSRAPF